MSQKEKQVTEWRSKLATLAARGSINECAPHPFRANQSIDRNSQLQIEVREARYLRPNENINLKLRLTLQEPGNSQKQEKCTSVLRSLQGAPVIWSENFTFLVNSGNEVLRIRVEDEDS